MTGSALLDTSTVIGLFQEQRRFTLESFDRVALCSLTYAELRLGVSVAPSAVVARQRMTALEEAQSVFGAGIAFDDEAARLYGRITARAGERGGDPKAHRTDRMIAAVAAAHDLTLVTLNPADLRGLDGLVRVVAPPAT